MSRPRHGQLLAACFITRPRYSKLLAVCSALVLFMTGGLGYPLEDGAAAAPTDPQVMVSITEISPRVPQPGDTITVRGEVVNAGAAPVDDVAVALRVSRTALYNRTEIDLISRDTPRLRDGLPVSGTRAAVAPRLASGDRASFTVSVAVVDLDLPGNGVYVLGVEALGHAAADRTGSQPEPTRLGLRKTFLPWMPRTDFYVPTRLSMLWPLATQPSIDGHGRLTSDALPSELAPGGRLSALLAGAGTAPVTWAVDPELLDTVATMTGAGGTPSPGPTSSSGPSGSPGPTRRQPATSGAGATATQASTARAWLEAAKRTLAGPPLIALPYADVDVQALHRAGRDPTVERALRRGAEVTAHVLGRRDGGVAWPADGFAEAGTLAVLRAHGARTFVLDSRAVTANKPLSYTPTGRAQVRTKQGVSDVLVADGGLTDALSGDLAGAAQGTLAAQRFLAETAMITAERPNLGRVVLAAPPRRWAPPAPWLTALFSDLRQAPWVRLAGLDELRRTAVPAELGSATLAYPDKAAAAELDRTYLAEVAAVEQDARRFAELLESPGQPLADYDTAVLGALSSAWRQAPQEGARFLRRLAGQVRSHRSKVHIIGRGLVTLSSASGTIPVTVSNELDQPVVVRLRAVPRVASRLRVTGPAPVTIGARRKQTIEVAALAAANGITTVDVQLMTPSGTRYGPVVPVRVNATNYGSLGTGVVLFAAGLLVAAAALRNIRRFRAAHRAQPTATTAAEPHGGRASADEKVEA